MDKSDSANLSYRLLTSSPDTVESFQFPGEVLVVPDPELEEESAEEPEPPAKGRKGRPPKSRFQDSSPAAQTPVATSTETKENTHTKRVFLPVSVSPDPETILSTLPTDLVILAQKPIIRGDKPVVKKGKGKVVSDVGGIVGNVRYVVEARRLVYDAVTNGGAVPDNWEDIVDVDVEKANAKSTGRKGVPKLICPECRGPI